jgi:CRISPR/Cas system endoribonuclease Cas6 (RAMP superfamily)
VIADNPNCNAPLCKNAKLITEQIIKHINPTNIKDPRLVKSFLVIYPRRLIPPKKVEVIKKQFATLVPVYIKNKGDKNAPIKAEYIQNKLLAISKDIVFILMDKYITIPSVASIKKKENPPAIKLSISGEDMQSIETNPVTHNAINILVKTERMYFCNPLSKAIGPL